mmetsp:Transcript_4065/g.11654  ORF Transcript_4065/g.11654 Transcript_4065/m.11654 type:complete len:130 (+) Transcript_4065:190-579(+)
MHASIDHCRLLVAASKTFTSPRFLTATTENYQTAEMTYHSGYYSIQPSASCETQASASSLPSPMVVEQEHKRRSDSLDLGGSTERSTKRTKVSVQHVTARSSVPSSPIRLHGPFAGCSNHGPSLPQDHH